MRKSMNQNHSTVNEEPVVPSPETATPEPSSHMDEPTGDTTAADASAPSAPPSKPKKRRKPKVKPSQTYAGRRNADRAIRARRRSRQEKRAYRQAKFRFRVRVVRTYKEFRKTMKEKDAVAHTLAKYEPTRPDHFPLSESTIRTWVRLEKKGGVVALRPRSTRPERVHYQVPLMAVAIIYTIRTVLGWGGTRIAKELEARGIAKVSGKTVYTIMDRLDCPVKAYALKGKSDGIAYRRYEKAYPNAQWHLDCLHLRLADGSSAWVCSVIDDYSRYVLCAFVATSASGSLVTRVAEEAFRRAGFPAEIVTDNGPEVVSQYEESLTAFGRLLEANGVLHRKTAKHYPQGNGKVEAFNKTLRRECLERQTFTSLEEVQVAVDRYITYYNTYRLHSGIGWQAPVTRYLARVVKVQGLGGILGLEGMAANAQYGPSSCDPPQPVTPVGVKTGGTLACMDGFATIQC